MRIPAIALTACLAATWVVAGPSSQTVRKNTAAKKTTSPPAPAGEDWLLWGGKNRDFIVNATGLADSWPQGGPKKIWSRPLGDGYSSIAEEAGVLYTTFRRNTQDVITALDAASGKTLWEFAYDNPFTNSYSEAVGPGPYAMPQVIGDRLLTASATGK